jgi:hypothetical protein
MANAIFNDDFAERVISVDTSVSAAAQTLVKLERPQAATLTFAVWPNYDIDSPQQWAQANGWIAFEAWIDGRKAQAQLLGPRGLRRTLFCRALELTIIPATIIGNARFQIGGTVGVSSSNNRNEWLAYVLGSTAVPLARFASELKIDNSGGDPGDTITFYEVDGTTALYTAPLSLYQDWQIIPIVAGYYSISAADPTTVSLAFRD